MGIKNQSKKKKNDLAHRMIPGPGGPSNPSQVQVGMWLQGPPTKLTSQSSTGLISAAITPSLNAVTNSSSFKTVYDEWRLTKIRFTCIPLGTNGGTTKFVLDDADATLPNSTYAGSRRGSLTTNNSSYKGSTLRLNYRSQDLSDLEWYGTASASTYTPVALKVYTDLSTYVTQPSTDLWLISWEGYFEFRGIGAE